MAAFCAPGDPVEVDWWTRALGRFRIPQGMMREAQREQHGNHIKPLVASSG
jgi:hypothetical protein